MVTSLLELSRSTLMDSSANQDAVNMHTYIRISEHYYYQSKTTELLYRHL